MILMKKYNSGGVVPWKTQVGGKYHCGPRTTWDPKSSRGGYGKLLENGADPICNPNSDKPCCSPYGFCGDTNAHCQYQDFSVLAKDKNEREWTTRNSGPDSLHGGFCQNTLHCLFSVTCPRDFPFRDANAHLCKSGQDKKVPCASKPLVGSNISKNTPQTIVNPNFSNSCKEQSFKLKAFFHKNMQIEGEKI